MKNVLFLVSGNGGTLKFLNEAINILNLNIKINAVIADRDCGAIKYSKNNNIPTYKIIIRDGNQDELMRLIDTISPDLVITNIHKILKPEIINIENIKFINLHYSLLPSYSGIIGMKTIDEARNDNAMFIGSTVHCVSEQVDSGRFLGQCSLATDWKKNSVEDYYDIIFQGSCLILLNYIVCFSLYNKLDRGSYKGLIFNPILNFSTSKFNSYFWNKIKNN